MAKELVPKKLVVDFENGSFKSGTAIYRVRTDGVLDTRFKSVEIKNIGFNKTHLNAILIAIRNHIRTIEGISS